MNIWIFLNADLNLVIANYMVQSSSEEAGWIRCQWMLSKHLRTVACSASHPLPSSNNPALIYIQFYEQFLFGSPKVCTRIVFYCRITFHIGVLHEHFFQCVFHTVHFEMESNATESVTIYLIWQVQQLELQQHESQEIQVGP